MTKEELEARLNAAEKEIADLKAKLNEASEIPDYPEFDCENEEFADICRKTAMLLHCKWHIDRDYVPNWKNNNEIKYCVAYDHSRKSYVLDWFYTIKYSTVYFSSAQTAQKAADWMNKRHKQERSD